jgi:hypothetical protein
MSSRRDERSERSPQSSKEWEDVWEVSTPCKLLIPSMSLDARSESMALTPSIWWISPNFPQI